jgi:hypothetical protein
MIWKQGNRFFLSFMVFCFFAVHPASADGAPVGPPPGKSGGVMPFADTDIRLLNERIDIYLYEKYYEVKVEYEFFNEGDERAVVIGFPVNEVDLEGLDTAG